MAEGPYLLVLLIKFELFIRLLSVENSNPSNLTGTPLLLMKLHALIVFLPPYNMIPDLSLVNNELLIVKLDSEESIAISELLKMQLLI